MLQLIQEVIIVATEKPRYTISVDDELYKLIEDFRFENRYQTRSAATVELLKRGLGVNKKDDKKAVYPWTKK